MNPNVFKQNWPFLPNMDMELEFEIVWDPAGETYEAIPLHKRIAGGTWSETYMGLRENVREFTELSLSDGFAESIGMVRNPSIRLRYDDVLAGNPSEGEPVEVRVSQHGGVFSVLPSSTFSYSSSNPDFDVFKAELVRFLENNYSGSRPVKVRLEDVFDAFPKNE